MTGIRALNPKMTRAGMRAVFNSSDDGLQARISHIGLGNRRYNPDGLETSLQNEIVRIPVLGGKYLSDYIIEIVSLLDHSHQFEVAEVGIFLEDGTLLAVWSDSDAPLAFFMPGVPIAISYVLGISSLPPDSLNISGDVDLSLFFGTEFAAVGVGITECLKMIHELQQSVRHLTEQDIANSMQARRLDLVENAVIDMRN